MLMGNNNNTSMYYSQCINVFDFNDTKTHHYEMSKLRENLRREMDIRGWNAYDMAEESGVPQPTTDRFLNGKIGEPRGTTVRKWAAALKMHEGQLRGLDDYIDSYATHENSLPLTSQLNEAGRRIPLIELRQAGAWKEAIKNHTPGVGDVMVLHEIGGNAFAITLDSDSMEPRFQEGDVILIDPDLTPEHKQFVVANVSGDIVFRRYWREAGKCMLKPLNKRYDDNPIDDAAIIGVATKKYIIEELL